MESISRSCAFESSTAATGKPRSSNATAPVRAKIEDRWPMARVGFTQSDFDVFKIEGFSARMGAIYERIRPRLTRLGNELAPELSRNLEMEFFAHVPRHARRTVNPPPE